MVEVTPVPGVVKTAETEVVTVVAGFWAKQWAWVKLHWVAVAVGAGLYALVRHFL